MSKPVAHEDGLLLGYQLAALLTTIHKHVMNWMKKGRWANLGRVAVKMAIGTAGFLAAFFLVHLPHGPEHWSADLRTAWFADRLNGQHPHIVIVEVTEQTLRESDYLSPVDRALLASIVRALNDAEAKIIGLDFIFDRRTETPKDNELLRAIQESNAVVILGALDERSGLTEERRKFQATYLGEAKRPVGHLYYGEHHNSAVISDYVVRDMADPAEKPQTRGFSELIARAAGTYRPPASSTISWLRPPKDGRETFLTLSGDDVLGRGLASPLPLKEMLRSKIVLVGGNFPDRDQHLTPLSVLHGERYPGIFIHAQMLAQLSDPTRRPIYGLNWVLWMIIVSATISFGFVVGVSPRLHSYRPWVEISAVIFFIVIGLIAFLYGRFVFPFVAAVLGWGWGEMVGHLYQRSNSSSEAGGSHDAV